MTMRWTRTRVQINLGSYDAQAGLRERNVTATYDMAQVHDDEKTDDATADDTVARTTHVLIQRHGTGGSGLRLIIGHGVDDVDAASLDRSMTFWVPSDDEQLIAHWNREQIRSSSIEEDSSIQRTGGTCDDDLT